MNNKILINGETLTASQQVTLATELFLSENYLFRRNVLSGKVEFFDKPSGKAERASVSESADIPAFRVLTPEALNSIVIRAKREQICQKGSPKTEIMDFVRSEEVPVYNPIRDYLTHLPRWDGQNHVSRVFSRLPGISSEQHGFLATWLRSTVAHWLQMDTLHGNECVLTLIGAQGCGKTTFVQRLLPPEFREYYLDYLNLTNKFDKEMALTNNLLVNLDELEAIRPSQHADLKRTLSKSKVNGRPIYGAAQEDRPRFASFVSTTNNPHPLTDTTGSRRYICLTIPQGMFINNEGEIDYPQLYAQVLHEILDLKIPYWFNNAEVARIQDLNRGYMEQKDMAEIVEVCFRKPQEGEHVKLMNGSQILKMIQQQFPTVKIDHSTRIHLGLAMKELGYQRMERGNVAHYKVVPLKVV